MASGIQGYNTLQKTAVTRQHVVIYDLYGLLGVPPNVDQAGIHDAYEGIIKKLQPAHPSNATQRTMLTNALPVLPLSRQINAAYGVLTNPHKRAQYDRDRLEYLYAHFATHDDFSNLSGTDTSADVHDEQIQGYAAALASRVCDPLAEKKALIHARIARTRADLDDFNDKSLRHRQDWATSPNQILRMAGNALREIVVCAEGDLCMLEDELGRLEGILDPKDQDGPAGRVASGTYGSDIEAAAAIAAQRFVGKLGVSKNVQALNSRIPSIPRSPTVALKPRSASKLGVVGEDSGGRGDLSSESESEGQAEKLVEDRIKNFLLGPMGAGHGQGGGGGADMAEKASAVSTILTQNMDHEHHLLSRSYDHVHDQRDIIGSLAPHMKKSTPNKDSPSPSTLLRLIPPQKGDGMGLVEWQTLHGPRNPEVAPENDPFWKTLTFQPFTSATAEEQKKNKTHETNNTNKLGAYPNYAIHNMPTTMMPDFGMQAATAPPQDSTISPEFKRPNRPWRTSTPPPKFADGLWAQQDLVKPSDSYGFHVAQPGERATTGLTPGGRGLASLERSEGIKEFQLRVWTAAKEAQALEAMAKRAAAVAARPVETPQPERADGSSKAQQDKKNNKDGDNNNKDSSYFSADTLAAAAATAAAMARGEVGSAADGAHEVFRRVKSARFTASDGHTFKKQLDDPFT
ncbi:hypothetical protein M406DRAFT_67809 [Cryphonectria parasitica EP155]|uniref:J domain-containing protein n=1 Tax=Cryphonectria parasitica (strain ATCC 38755 / EP155) TaxID=660469 RepID=A0A9P4Y2L9_CRYP1|nr:uncharacterized protein M406DRAFT_67809 [Cryphonectria parasitica EP155]KAF3765353.1 hypothetical protein M406DRAFT_67809 [Cryphonectria parasitica EP155]